jgi:hypothetical protein
MFFDAPNLAWATPGFILLAGAGYFLTWRLWVRADDHLVYSRWPLAEQVVDLRQLTGGHLYRAGVGENSHLRLALSDRKSRRLDIRKPSRKVLGAIEAYIQQAGLELRDPDKRRS